MSRVVAALCVAGVLAGGQAGAQSPADSMPRRPAPAPLPPDRWLGVDKVKHFFLAGLTTATAFSAGRASGLDRRPALGVAVGTAALVAIGKEVRDRRVTGRFSARDLVADALGVAAYGALLVRTAR